MQITLAALRGRIVEKYGTYGAFADAIGKKRQYLGMKLNGKVGITKDDIDLWSKLLDISTEDIGRYFFT